LINSSANRIFLIWFIGCVVLSGCAFAPLQATNARKLPPPLVITDLSPDKPSPQSAERSTVRWNAGVAGAVGELTFEFRVHDGKAEKTVQTGPSPAWDWSPAIPGTYRVKVVARDSIGNTAESGWSAEYGIAPSLVVSSPTPDKGSPQAAEMATVRWTAGAAGGVGEHSFEFRIHDGKEGTSVQSGHSPTWEWSPMKPGTYRVQVVVRDSIGTTMESGWSREYRVVPRLVVSSLAPDKPSPQAAEMATVRWNAQAAGGVGGRTFEFRIHDGKEEKPAQKGLSPVWEWKPLEPGSYRVKVVVRDSIGNAVASGWSKEYGIAPKLVVSSITADKASPQAAEMVTVRWKAEAAGGIGERSFEFRIFDGKSEKAAQRGPSGIWHWSPGEPGSYRVKAVVRDSIGNMVEGEWSPEYVVAPRLTVSSLAPDKVSPQAAEMATIRWKIEAAGGVGERFFEFRIHDGKEEKPAQKGPASTWDWKPVIPGTYRIKAVVGDSIGNTAESAWSPEYVVAFPLVASLPPPDKTSPQAAEMATVRWKAEAAGGVGMHIFEFRIHDGKEGKPAQKGPSSTWDWKPVEPGVFRVQVAVTDAVGNTVEGRWSTEFVVAPKLKVSSLSPEIPSPQPAFLSSIRWTAEVQGGVGNRSHTFWKSDGKEEKEVQSGPLSSWEWSPRKTGTYRVKVVVRDSIGNMADSGWSSVNEIGFPLDKRSLIAVMPMENLSGTAVPLKELTKSLREALKSGGLNLLDEGVLEKFMEKHRVRFAGGLTEGLGKAFEEETGTKAVLFLSFDLYDESDPPKIALTARLVSAGRWTSILWMDGVAVAGNDSPGLLGLGWIRDPRKLWAKASKKIVGSLTAYLDGRGSDRRRGGTAGKYRPKSSYKGTPKPEAGMATLRIAVLPFLNESTRRNAGEIMTLHFLRGLSDQENLLVIEPGEVRQALLMSRTIMEGGLSLPQAEVLQALLGVDLVLMGNVTYYEDYSGPRGSPRVNFSVRVLDTRSKRVMWSSISHNLGDDGVFFFDAGKVQTAHSLASAMVRAVVRTMQP
jgi:hypothetical protein